MSALPLILPREAAAEGSLAAAFSVEDQRLKSILPLEALRVSSHPGLTGNRATATTALSSADFTTTGEDARDQLDRILGGEGALVTTGQQPGLFLGPLYTLYKALTASELAARLARLWDVPVLPVFWVASDDHDWEEVATTHVLGQDGEVRTVRLPAPDGHAHRSVGAAPVTDAVLSVLEEVEQGLDGLAFGGMYAALLRDAYVPGQTLGHAFIDTLAAILRERPFALIDAGAPAVKRASVPVARRALAAQAATESALRDGAERLEAAGFPATIPVLPEASCLFMDTGVERVRLYVREGIAIAGRDGPEMSLEATFETLEEEPERFSPNVALRPVLESSLMPVAATVLGPGELGYWAQLPDMFRLFDQQMPLVRPRAAWTILEAKPARTLEKLGARPEDMADGGVAFLERRIVEERPAEVAVAVAALRESLQEGFDRLERSVESELPGLRSAAGRARAEARKALKRFDRSVNSRLRESQTVQRERAELATRHVYPQGSAQERFYTPISYLARYGPDLVDAISAEGQGSIWPGGPDVALVDEPE